MNTKKESLDSNKESLDSNEESSDTKEESSETEEESSDTKEESSDTEEESSDTKEESSDTEEESSDTKEESSDTEEESLDTKEESSDTKEESLDTKEESSNTKEESSDMKEESSDTKEESLDTEEESSNTEEKTSNSNEESSDSNEESLDSKKEVSTSSKDSTSIQNLLDQKTLFSAIPKKPYQLNKNMKKILRLLGENSKNWEHRSDDELNPLEHAVEFSVVSVVRYLLRFKPSRSIMHPALIRAYCYGHGASLEPILAKDTSLMDDVDVGDYFEKKTDKIISSREREVFYRVGKSMAHIIEQTKSAYALVERLKYEDTLRKGSTPRSSDKIALFSQRS